MYGPVSNQSDAQQLQDDLDALTKWSGEWLLQFNLEKCKVMHCGSQNPKFTYRMKTVTGQAQVLEETLVEKDLGVYITNTLKPSLNSAKSASRAMSALRVLRLTFGRLTVGNFKILFSVYVRPHLEHCIQATSPYLVKDIRTLEKVQRRATKLVQGLKWVPYEERLKVLEMTSMEERIRRGDLIETYKILTGKVNISPCQFFINHQDRTTRGHHLKLKIRRARTQARAKLFANRVVLAWNKLSTEIITSENTNTFKNRLDKLRTVVALSSLFNIHSV